MIKTIIFDLGGVVVGTFGKELIVNASKKLGIPPVELRKVMDKYEPDLQTGKLNHMEFWKKILRKKGTSVSDQTLKYLWLDPYKKDAKINRDIIKLIEKLKKKYVIGCICNGQEPHHTYNKKRRLFDYFDLYLLSSEVGIRKPDPKIFDLYLKKVNCTPNEAIFIDDEKRYLGTPKKLGINTILFKGTNQLKRELSKIIKKRV